jgi:hypothetical protein
MTLGARPIDSQGPEHSGKRKVYFASGGAPSAIESKGLSRATVRHVGVVAYSILSLIAAQRLADWTAVSLGKIEPPKARS